MPGVDYRQGDYRVVADRLRPAAQRLVELAGVGPGDVVLDLGAGTGNVSRLCAARGASALAVDRVPEQLLLGREDGDARVRWVAGDAVALPLRDGVVTTALSAFALIYVPEPAAALQELARVCRPGSVLGLTAWPRGGLQEGLARVLADLAGITGTGADHLADWGDADGIARRLAPVADDVRVSRHSLDATFPSFDAWWASRARTPPVMTARQVLDDARFAELGRRLREVAALHSGPAEDGGCVLRDAYLTAVCRLR